MEISLSPKRKNNLKIKKPTAILAHQRISTKKKFNPFKNMTFRFAIFLTALILSIYKILPTLLTFKPDNLVSLNFGVDPQILIQQEQGTKESQFTEIELSKIREEIAVYLKSTGTINLAKLMEKIRRSAQISYLHLYSPSTEMIEVHLKKMTPFLIVKSKNKDYFASFEGDLYEIDSANAVDLPTLYGIIDIQVKPQLSSEEQTISIDDEGKALLKECIDLIKKSREHSLEFSVIEFKKFRGFFVSTKLPTIDIAMGRAPYNEKIERLVQLLSNLKSKGILAKKIELDYEGKAFITETHQTKS